MRTVLGRTLYLSYARPSSFPGGIRVAGTGHATRSAKTRRTRPSVLRVCEERDARSMVASTSSWARRVGQDRPAESEKQNT